MNIDEFCKKLGISYHEPLDEYFSKGQALLSEHGTFAVDKARLIKLNEKYNFMRSFREEILAGCDEVRKDEALLLFVYVLAAIYKDGKTPTYSDNGVSVTITDIPDRERFDTDIAPLYSSYFFLEEMIEDYERRRLPYEVISDTLAAMELEMNDYVGIYGRVGMRRYVSWYFHWVKRDLISIGRFQFEIMPFRYKVRAYRRGDDVKLLLDGSTVNRNGLILGAAGANEEEGSFFADIKEDRDSLVGYTTNEFGECVTSPVRLEGYKEILRQGSMVLNVHIPSKLPLTPEICEKSYNDAVKILKKAYPEYDFKAICCASWMMEKRICEILGKKTNLSRFSDPYIGFPLQSQGKAIYSFVYNLHQPIPTEELSEDTSLRRAIKQHLLKGGFVYEKGGIIPIDTGDKVSCS
jgi:hypothetical protein